MNSALAFNLDRAGQQGTLQRHLHQQPISDLSKHLHVVQSEPSALQHLKHGVEYRPVSSPKTPSGMGHLISQALWRRVGKTVTRKQLRHELDVSDGTIDNLLAGKGEPTLRVFTAMLRYFGSDFANEVMGHLGVKISKPDDASRKVLEGLEELGDPVLAGVFAEAIAKVRAGR